jgi:RNA polymerase sigma factor (TIGR02999 family)
MSDASEDELRTLVEAINAGDRHAATRLFEVLYGELRALARSRLSAQGPAATLDPTALVHETFLRLDASPLRQVEGRGHFVGLVGRAMRRVMIDRARRRRALKRGSDPLMTTLSPDQAQPRALSADDLLSLDASLSALEQHDASMAGVVELKYFGGFSFREIAAALDISERTAHRRWRAARAWLIARLE